MYEYPFTLPPYYTAVIRCLGVLEGVALQATPPPPNAWGLQPPAPTHPPPKA